jgi:hypothetical protein
MSAYGYTLIAEAVRGARKKHRCIWCGESILPGEQYRDERSSYCGSFQHHRWHPECDEAFKAELSAGGDEEFSPYDNERPESAAGVDLPDGVKR